MVAFEVTSIVRNARAAGLVVGVVFALVVASTLIAIVTVVGGKDTAFDDARALNRANALDAAHAEKLAEARGYVLAHDSEAYADYDAAHRKVHRVLRQLRRDHPSGELGALVSEVARREALWDEGFAAVIAASSDAPEDRAAVWNRTVRPRARSVMEALSTLIARLDDASTASAQRAARQESRAVVLLVVVVGGVLLLGALGSAALGRSAARGLAAEQQSRVAAEQSRGFLAALLDQLPIGVIIAEAPSGEIVHVSEAARALLGRARPDPGELPLAPALRGEQVRAELTWSPAGRAFESHAGPVRDDTGAVVAAMVTFSEVTERQRAEAERQRFLDILAHDLRNPIGAIIMAADLLAEQGGLPDRATRAAARIRSSSERMRRLIEELMDFSRSRSGTMVLEVRPLDLAEITREIVEDVRLGCPQCDLLVDSRGPVVGEWDHDRLAQALHNIVGNAVEHSAPETAVQIEVGGDTVSCFVRVTNHGETIAPDTIGQIFDPFRRGANSRGLGLGLFIARSIVEAHGGTIAVESEDGETTFTIRLPCGARASATRTRSFGQPRSAP